MVKLYHYTNFDGVQGILNAEKIEAKWPHKGQADMPFGVYLTELPPDSPPDELILNNYDDGMKILSNSEFISKVQFYFEFNSENLPQVYRNKTRRNEFICPHDITVDPEHDVYGMAGSINSSELSDCLHRFIAKNIEMIDSLESITNEINEFYQKKNVVKTMSTSLSAVGAAMTIGGVFLAPFTAGASLSLTAFALVPTIGGAVSAVEISLIDYFQSKGFDKKIKKIIEEQNSIAKELKPMLQNLNALVTDLQKLGMSEEEAFGSTLNFLAKGFIQLKSKVKTAVVNYRNAQKVLKMCKVAKNLSKTGVVAKYTLGMTGAPSTYGKAIAKMTAVEMTGIGKSIGSINTTIGIGVGKQVTRTVGFALNFAFVAYDIYDTVEGWKSSHPKIKDITILTEKLNSEIQQFEMLLKVLEQQKD